MQKIRTLKSPAPRFEPLLQEEWGLIELLVANLNLKKMGWESIALKMIFTRFAAQSNFKEKLYVKDKRRRFHTQKWHSSLKLFA